MAGISRAEANARLKTLSIKGKQYTPVSERVLAFWDVYPEGAISTEFLRLDDDVAVCMATVSNMGVVLAMGTAAEIRSASSINKTSYVENCETSAIGRALGFAGIGTDGSIASAEEVLDAKRRQRAIELAEQIEVQPAPERQEPQPDPMHEAREAYLDALEAYCQRVGKQPSDLLQAHEGFVGAEFMAWTIDQLRSLADKFPKEASRG